MSAASDDELSRLHKVVAEKLTTILSDGVTVQSGEGTAQITAGAAYFAATIAFLKNNNVTASKDNEALKGLKDQLAARRAKAKGQITHNSIADAEKQLEKELGDMGMGGFLQ
jgi:hypothetical protein